MHEQADVFYSMFAGLSHAALQHDSSPCVLIVPCECGNYGCGARDVASCIRNEMILQWHTLHYVEKWLESHAAAQTLLFKTMLCEELALSWLPLVQLASKPIKLPQFFLLLQAWLLGIPSTTFGTQKTEAAHAAIAPATTLPTPGANLGRFLLALPDLVQT